MRTPWCAAPCTPTPTASGSSSRSTSNLPPAIPSQCAPKSARVATDEPSWRLAWRTQREHHCCSPRRCSTRARACDARRSRRPLSPLPLQSSPNQVQVNAARLTRAARVWASPPSPAARCTCWLPREDPHTSSSSCARRIPVITPLRQRAARETRANRSGNWRSDGGVLWARPVGCRRNRSWPHRARIEMWRSPSRRRFPRRRRLRVRCRFSVWFAIARRQRRCLWNSSFATGGRTFVRTPARGRPGGTPRRRLESRWTVRGRCRWGFWSRGGRRQRR